MILKSFSICIFIMMSFGVLAIEVDKGHFIRISEALENSNWDVIRSYADKNSEASYGGGQGTEATLFEIQSCRQQLQDLVHSCITSGRCVRDTVDMLPPLEERHDDYDGAILNFRYHASGKPIIDFVVCYYH